MTQEVLKLSQEALAGLKDVEKQVRELIAENKALKEALREHAMREVQRLGQEIEQEPCDMGEMCLGCSPRRADGSCPDATPPQRTFVGLTDEEIKKIAKKHKWHESNVAPHLMPVYRSLEAKLKEKNNAA